MKNFKRLTLIVMAIVVALCSTQAAMAQSDDATKQYRRAVNLHNTDAFDLAIKQWQLFIENFPEDTRADRASHYLGVCYFQERDFAGAAKTFAEVITKYPKLEILDETYYNLGLARYNLGLADQPGQFDASAEAFESLIEKYPDFANLPEAIFYAGECYYKRGAKQKAADKYALLIEKKPNHPLVPQALLALGVAQADQGTKEGFTAALGSYDKLLARTDLDAMTTAEGQMWRGDALFGLNKYNDAAKAFTAAAGAAGFSMADYATLRKADALAGLGKYAEAADTYASLITSFPQSGYVPLCQLEAGKKYFAAGQYDKSRTYLADVIAAGGESAIEASHWTALGQLKSNPPAAAEALKTVEAILPSAEKSSFYPQLLMDQADAIYEIPDRRGESTALYAALATKFPNDALAPQALYLAAFSAMGQADFEKATEYAQAYLAAHAENPDKSLTVGVKHVLAESLLLQKQHAKAEALYIELLAAAPGDREAEVWKIHLGTALYLQKKYQEAIDQLTPVLSSEETPVKNQIMAAEGWYRVGKSQASLGDYKSSIASLDKSLAANATWALADDARLALGLACQQTGDLERAATEAATVISDFPQSKQLDLAHFRLGEAKRLSKQLAPATVEYEKLLKDYSDSPLVPWAHYGLAWAQLGLQKYADADTNFSALIDTHKIEKLIPRAKYGRGQAKYNLARAATDAQAKQDQYTAAVGDLSAFVDSGPTGTDKATALYMLGLCQKAIGGLAEAEKCFTTLIDEIPDYNALAAVYYDLGLTQRDLAAAGGDGAAEKATEAAATFATLVEKFPESQLVPDSNFFIGDQAFQDGDFLEASKAYYAAMNGAKEAGNARLAEEAAYNLGLSFYKREQYEKAQPWFSFQRKSWPEGPLMAQGAFMEAECLSKLNKFEEALEAYLASGKLPNETLEALRLIHAARAAAELGDWDQCLKLAEQCGTTFPDSPHFAEALLYQGRAKQQTDTEAAVALYRQAIEKAEGSEVAAKSLFWIGEIQFGDKKHDEAILTFIDVASNYGYPKWQAKSTLEAGRCFLILDKVPQALRQFQRLIEKFPDTPEAETAKTLIEKYSQE